MSVKDTWEPLYTCVRVLATLEGSPQDRLVEATLGPLSQVGEENLPENLRGHWQSIRKRISPVAEAGPGGVVAAGEGGVDEATAIEIIRDIVSLYNSVTVAYALESASLAVDSE